MFLFALSSGAQRSKGLQGSGGDSTTCPPDLGGSWAWRRKPSHWLPGGETGRVAQDLGQGRTSISAFITWHPNLTSCISSVSMTVSHKELFDLTSNNNLKISFSVLFFRWSQESRIRSSPLPMWLKGRSICSESPPATSVDQESQHTLMSPSMSPLLPVSMHNYSCVNFFKSLCYMQYVRIFTVHYTQDIQDAWC